MERYTPEKIAKVCEDLNGPANTAAINKLFREQDESHLWPINNKFNATERAIRRLAKIRREGCGPEDGLEYALALALDAEISNIVNNERNW